MTYIFSALGVSSGPLTGSVLSTQLEEFSLRLAEVEQEHWDDTQEPLHVSEVMHYFGSLDDCPVETSVPSFATQVSVLYVRILDV